MPERKVVAYSPKDKDGFVAYHLARVGEENHKLTSRLTKCFVSEAAVDELRDRLIALFLEADSIEVCRDKDCTLDVEIKIPSTFSEKDLRCSIKKLSKALRETELILNPMTCSIRPHQLH